MNPPTASIEHLPWEMISELFKYLSPKDLATCSMVNKRWHSVYATFKLHGLEAFQNPDYGFAKWFNSNQPIPEAARCNLPLFCRLVDKPLLSNLRQLVLCGYEFKYDLNELNRFQQLVHLEINISPLGEMKVHLNLPRLRVLAFRSLNHRCALSIDCPFLNLLYYDEAEDANLLNVKHPETIKRLEADLVGPQLAPFKNVECLVTKKFEPISKATLISLPALRELRYNEDIQTACLIFRDEVNTVDEMKQTLSEFLDEAKRLRGRDFRFIFAGFQLTNVNLDQIDFGVQVDEEDRFDSRFNEYIYMKNYHLIEPNALDFIRSVDYSRLRRHAIGEIPRCFLQKFTGIEEVHGKGVSVQSGDQFLQFLKSLRFLRRLVLDSAELSQEFYDKLPASARSLVRLHLKAEREPKKEIHLNFDFICEFSGLSTLRVQPALSLESATSLVRWLGRLAEANFFVLSKEGRLRIGKAFGPKTVWCIYKFVEYGRDQLLFRTKNPNQIVPFIKELQSAVVEAPESYVTYFKRFFSV